MFKKIRNCSSRSFKVMEIGFSQAKVSLNNLSILEDWLILEAGLGFVFFFKDTASLRSQHLLYSLHEHEAGFEGCESKIVQNSKSLRLINGFYKVCVCVCVWSAKTSPWSLCSFWQTHSTYTEFMLTSTDTFSGPMFNVVH